MKHRIPAATFTLLLSGKSVLSKSDTVLYTELATKAASDVDIELLRRLYEQKFLHIKQKAKARVENKKRLVLAFHEVSREAFFATTGKVCDPTAAATDVGILDNSCLPNQFCIEDSASELGGVCAKVVVRKVDDQRDEAHIEGGRISVEDVGGGEVVAVGSMKQKTQVRDGSESNDKFGGDEYLAGVDWEGYDDGGYEDNRGLDFVDSKYRQNVSVELTDEDREVVVDGVKAFSGPKLLKPFSMQDSWKAAHILERSREGSQGYLPLVGGECNPGTIDGFVDVSILGCSSGHFCAKDSYSNLGGTCVNIGVTTDFHEGGKHRHLLTCAYLNGTSGEKCSGLHACGDLSSDFIANNVGCGSCNAYGACTGLSGTFLMSFYFSF